MVPNRAERRRMEKEQKSKSKILQITREKLDELVEATTRHNLEIQKKDLINITANCMFAAFTIALNQTLGYGKKRIIPVLEEVDKQYSLVNDGIIDCSDLINAANDIGIEITIGDRKY